MVEATTPAVRQVDKEPTYRRNFLFFLSDGILFTVAMNIISPTTIIPDFIRHLTNSEILIGLSGSLFDICWTIPQLFIARYIVRAEWKKWWFVGPSIPVRFVILSFAGIAILLGKDKPEAILMAFLICYGIAGFGDGIVGVPWADLTGTSLDERWRARMFGLMTAIVGVIMLAISPLIGVILSDAGPGFPNNYALLFGAAGLCFAVSVLPILMIRELPGGKGAEQIPSFGEYLPLLGKVLQTDAPFRATLVARILTCFFTMAGPFYIGFATVQLKLSSNVAVPTLLAMQTVGSVSGSVVYAWLGARNNSLYLRLALGGATLLPVSALFAAALGPWPLYLGFLIAGFTLSNLYLSYQNWVVTHAEADQRPLYAGLFNTLIAGFTLVAPILGGVLVQQLGYEFLFAISLLMGCGSLFVMWRYVPDPAPAQAQ